MAAQLNAQQRRVSQVQANLRRASDVLDKYNVYSPIDGVVTNLPVRVGETVVPGIQNSPASNIMTVADMSLITAEVKVDETDIVNVKLGQTSDVTIDAIPNRTFKGRVIEIGNTAILRSTGLAASQSTVSSQEAKDFKVVIALTDPPEDIRPGIVVHRQGNDSHPKPFLDNSDGGPDGSPEGRSGTAEERREERFQSARSIRLPRKRAKRKCKASSSSPAKRRSFAKSRPELPARRTSKCSKASMKATKSSPAAIK